MSTPSSSGEEEKSSRMEYNALLAKSKSASRSATDGGLSSPQGTMDFWDDKRHPTTESLDFEEVESMIWRKVKTSPEILL